MNELKLTVFLNQCLKVKISPSTVLFGLTRTLLFSGYLNKNPSPEGDIKNY